MPASVKGPESLVCVGKRDRVHELLGLGDLSRLRPCFLEEAFGTLMATHSRLGSARQDEDLDELATLVTSLGPESCRNWAFRGESHLSRAGCFYQSMRSQLG